MKCIYTHVYTYIVNAKSFSPLSLSANLFLQASLLEKNQSHLFKVVSGKLGRRAGSGELSGGR